MWRSYNITNLSKKSEQAFSGGIHENELVFGFGIGAVRVKPEQKHPMWIIHDETVTGEEDGGLPDCEKGLFREAEFLVHDHNNLVHIHCHAPKDFKILEQKTSSIQNRSMEICRSFQNIPSQVGNLCHLNGAW